MLRQTYRPGDFLRVCERTGFVVYASRTKKEWTGRIVRDRSFEMRQPQDFVRGVIDDQRVPDPRPRPADTFVQIDTRAFSSGFSSGFS